MAEHELIKFEAVVAIAPGLLLRKWKANGRSYFHYATSAPLQNTLSFFSTNYATREAKWKDSLTGSKADPSLRSGGDVAIISLRQLRQNHFTISA